MRLAWLLVLFGCSGPPTRATPTEGALVIPPLAVDAGAPETAPTEPATLQGARGLSTPERDPRIASRSPRSRTLVLSDVHRLGRELAKTPASSLDRPQLRRRIAEAQCELAASASGPDAANARREAIDQYIAIRGESPSYPLLDEVLYYLALAYELNGAIIEARKTYFELIANAPSSKLVPLAYFAFGELFAAEAEVDPTKLPLAVQAYETVTKYPSQPIVGEALLRLGETHLQLGNDERARQAFDALRRDYAGSQPAARIPAHR